MNTKNSIKISSLDFKYSIDDISQLLISLQLVVCLAIVGFVLHGNQKVTSRLFSLTFVILAINFIVVLINRQNKSELFLLLCLLLLGLISVLLGARTITFEYLKKYLIFSSTPILFYVISNTKFNKSIMSFIYFIVFIESLLFIFYYFYNPSYYANGLTLNFSNPNALAMWLMHPVLFLAIFTYFFRNSFVRIINMVMIAFLLQMIIETRTRSVFIALLAFVILFLLIQFNGNIKIGTPMIIFFALYPLGFAFVYLTIVYSPWIQNLFGFLVSTGKNLDSRVAIWNQALHMLKNSILFGNYYDISISGLTWSQLHNSHLDILATFGIFVFSLFFVLILTVIKKIAIGAKSRIQKTAIMAFFAVLVMSSAEAALVSGSMGLYVFSCTFLIVAKIPKFQALGNMLENMK